MLLASQKFMAFACLNLSACFTCKCSQSAGWAVKKRGRGDGKKIKLGNRCWWCVLVGGGGGWFPSPNGDKNRNILLAQREHVGNTPTCTSICNSPFTPFAFIFNDPSAFVSLGFSFSFGLVSFGFGAATFNRFSVLAWLNETVSVLSLPPGS